MMESVLIEYLRFSNLDTGVLRAGETYILAHKNLPVKQVTTPVEQYSLLDKLGDCLRYNSPISNEEKWKTIVDISDEIKKFFIDIAAYNYTDCQLDVVLSASELGLLPFELLLDDTQSPWFASPEKKISFTRRFRQDHLENAFSWPFTPRVLFIYSHGGFQQVPFDKHINAFDFALNKWGGKENSKIFKVLEEPTFEVLAEELKRNDIPEKQFTHVHFLAHGALIQDKNKPYNYEFGIMFGKGEAPPTPTQSIKELFESLKIKPFVVNYMICDGANFSNPLKPDKNPVQVTHKAGVPVVLGSQYPLSMKGSVSITNKLYSSLFDGNDIREILTDIRQELFKRREEHHDWISLVSYVRLPEGYDDYLYKAALYCEMQNLRSAKSKTDLFLDKKHIDDDEFITMVTRLSRSIESLEKKLKEIEDNPKYQEESLENLGLLGSAYKRLAELYFLKERMEPNSSPDEKPEDQKSLLQTSLKYYKRACDKNLSHHWSLVQFLSLDVILNGQISDMGYWHAARTSIKNSLLHNPGDGWSYGSLVELFLLNLTGSESDNKEEILSSTKSLIKIAKEQKNNFLLESTYSQINRYKTWWVPKNGFQIDNSIHAANTFFLDLILAELETGINELKQPSPE
jgi:hypothetical protein